jgi:hypothetical protein
LADPLLVTESVTARVALPDLPTVPAATIDTVVATVAVPP